MSWFEHRHWWRRRGGHEIADGERTTGVLMVEECDCGAVRTIEIFQGRPPMVRIAAQPKDHSNADSQ